MGRRRDQISVMQDTARQEARLVEGEVLSVDIQTRRATVRLAGTSHTVAVGLGGIDPDSVLDGRGRILVYLSPYGGMYAVSLISDRPTTSAKPAATLGDRHGSSRWQVLNSDREPVFWIDSLGRMSFAGSYTSYEWTPGESGGGVTDASFLVLSLHSDLTDERVATAGTGITINPGTPGGNATFTHDTGNFGDRHTNYAEMAANESITGAWDFRAAGLTIGSNVLLYNYATNILALGTDDSMCIQVALRVGSLGSPLPVGIALDVDGAADVSGGTTIGGDLAVDGDTLYVDVSEDAVYVNPGGSIPPTFTYGALTVVPANATQHGLVIKPYTGQVSNIFDVLNEAGTQTLIKITLSGDLESGYPAYVSGLTGWQVSAVGNAEFNDVWIRGGLHASLFVADEMHAAGATIALLTSSRLAAAVTLPAVSSSVVLNIDGSLETGLSFFAANDIILIKAIVSLEPGIDIYNMYFTVTSVAAKVGSDPGYYPTTCVLRRSTPSATTGKIIPSGTTVVKWGKIGGKVGTYTGGMILTADLNYAPYIDVFTVPSSITTWTSDPTATSRVRLGNLDGVLGLGEQWGLAASSDLSDVAQPHVILSDQQLSLYGVAQYWWDTDGNARGEVDPSASSTPGTTDLLFWLGPSEAGAKFKVFGDGDVWLSTLAISEDSGAFLFSRADGLALWGPGCEIATDRWTSTRGQQAALTGALRQEQGAWPATRALQITKGTTNRVLNPNMGGTYVSGVAPSWTKGGTLASLTCTESTAFQVFGNKCQKLVFATGASAPYFYCSPTLANSATYTWQGWLYIESLTTNFRVRAQRGTWSNYTDKTFTTIGLHHFSFSAATVGSGADFAVRFYCPNNDAATVYLLGCQVEANATPTPLAAGDMGSGYSWVTPYTTATTRDATILQVPIAGVVGQAQGTIIVNFRLHAYNALGGTLWAAGNSNGEMDAYIDPTGILYYRINGATECSYSGIAEEEEYCAVFTWNVAANESKLYINSALQDSGTCGAWTIGTYFGIGYSPPLGNANYNLNGFVSQVATLGVVLTAEQVAAWYATARPLADAGAMRKPGVYVVDGMFAIASSTSGSRLELTSSYFSLGTSVAYDSGTGVWLGLVGGTPQMFIGNSAGNKILWDGSTLSVLGTITAYAGYIGGATGWVIETANLYSMESGGTPLLPNTGILLTTTGGYSSTPAIKVYNGASLVAQLGNYNASTAGLYAVSGKIASWAIGASAITSTNITLQSGASAYVGVGTGSYLGGLSAGSLATSVLIWAGSTYAGRTSAPFRVYGDGDTRIGSATNYMEWDGTNLGIYVGGGSVRLGQYGLLLNVESANSAVIWKETSWTSTVGMVRCQTAVGNFDMELIAGDNNATVASYPDFRVISRKTGDSTGKRVFEAVSTDQHLGVWTAAPTSSSMHVYTASGLNHPTIYAQQTNTEYVPLHLSVPSSAASWINTPYITFDGMISEYRTDHDGTGYWVVRVRTTGTGGPGNYGCIRIYYDDDGAGDD
jgi:hypothetical protein